MESLVIREKTNVKCIIVTHATSILEHTLYILGIIV